MREFTKSTLSLAWAVPVFGAKQIIDLLTRSTKPNQTATKSLDTATQAAGEQLGDVMQSMFQVGDDLQREVTETMLNMLHPGRAVKTTAEIVKWSSEMLRSIGPNKAGRLAWQELGNKLAAFNLVYTVPRTLDLPEEPPYPELSRLVERAYDLDEYPALWAVERLGHYHADTFWKRQIVPQNALTESRGLPDASLTMLHAGFGIGIARHFLQGINHLSSRSDIRRALKQIILLCKENSKPGYEGAAIESLGLISRGGTFHGDTRPEATVRTISDLLEETDPEAYAYFWHGVGRSIYFSPINFLPGYGAIWHPVEMIRRETSGRVARRNATAGLAWGVTMVNIRHPRILGNLLEHVNTDDQDERDGFKNGIMSALMARQDTTPDAPFVAGLYRQAPGGFGAKFTTRWKELVQQPCQDAFQEHYPIIKQHQRLGALFRYHDFPALRDRILSDKQAQ